MKILAVASIGGHWIQLLRLNPSFGNVEVEYVTTNSHFKSTVNGAKFHSIPDGHRRDVFGLAKCVFAILIIIIKTRPSIIITTGAAPGLLAILIGKIFCAKTIWVDSIANCEKVSLSCKIVSYFSDRTYTQWPHLETNRIKFKGNVLK
jgi:UDP-N-acetylglucosamine:LPS N-acetylglucosamine transferase